MQVSDTSEKCSCVPPSNAGNASLPPMDVVAVTDHENVASVAPVRPTDAASVPLRLHGYSMQEDEELMPKLDEHASDFRPPMTLCHCCHVRKTFVFATSEWPMKVQTHVCKRYVYLIPLRPTTCVPNSFIHACTALSLLSVLSR